MNDVNAEYDPEQYWGTVGAHIGGRSGTNVLAGDDEPFDRFKRDRFLDRFLHRLPVNGKRVLEIGCGPGGNLVELRGATGYHLIGRLAGVDISQEMVDIAQRSCGPQIAITKVDGTTLPFADGEFDVVFCATVLMHNVDAIAYPLIKEMCRVAKDNVIIIEEVAWAKRKDRYSYVKRTIDQYIGVAVAEGWIVSGRIEYLHHEVLQKLCRVPRRLLNRGKHEGARRNRASRLIERAMIRTVGWRVDDRLALKSGLVKVVFTR